MTSANQYKIARMRSELEQAANSIEQAQKLMLDIYVKPELDLTREVSITNELIKAISMLDILLHDWVR